MNKYRKSLDNIGEYFEEKELWNLMKNVSVLSKIVELSIPKKPNKNINNGLPTCPNCSNSYNLIDGYGDEMDYCVHCGQKIDWSKYEER